MAHSHDHCRHHHPHEPNNKRAFALGIGLNVVFVVIEIIYGFAANSSALLADAGHNTSDVLSFVFAWTATWKPTGKYTYGYRKTTILVSILNALILFGAVVAIGWDAIEKFKNPEPVAGNQVMIVAGIGIVINTFTALLFMKGQKDDLNIKGAFLHMAADAGVSLGVVVAGVFISLTGKTWIDPVTSILIIAVILRGTWRIFTDSIDLALHAVPKHIDPGKVREVLLAKNGVNDIHDLHVWAMSTTQVALTAHLIMPGGYNDQCIAELQKDLKMQFGIVHTTFQIEDEMIEKQCRTCC